MQKSTATPTVDQHSMLFFGIHHHNHISIIIAIYSFSRFYQLSLRLPVDKYPSEMEKEARDFQEFLKTKLEETSAVTQLKIPARIATRL
jgi:hypothetical protein